MLWYFGTNDFRGRILVRKCFRCTLERLPWEEGYSGARLEERITCVLNKDVDRSAVLLKVVAEAALFVGSTNLC